MRYSEPTGRTVLSLSALTVALLLGTASFKPAFAQSPAPQGAPSYAPGQTGGVTDSTSTLPRSGRLHTMTPQNRERLNNAPNDPANPNLAVGRPLGPNEDATNLNSTTRNPPDPIIDPGHPR